MRLANPVRLIQYDLAIENVAASEQAGAEIEAVGGNQQRDAETCEREQQQLPDDGDLNRIGGKCACNRLGNSSHLRPSRAVPHDESRWTALRFNAARKWNRGERFPSAPDHADAARGS